MLHSACEPCDVCVTCCKRSSVCHCVTVATATEVGGWQGPHGGRSTSHPHAQSVAGVQQLPRPHWPVAWGLLEIEAESAEPASGTCHQWGICGKRSRSIPPLNGAPDPVLLARPLCCGGEELPTFAHRLQAWPGTHPGEPRVLLGPSVGDTLDVAWYPIIGD